MPFWDLRRDTRGPLHPDEERRVLAGGGALIYGIDRFFEERLKTPVIITEDPIKAVVRGTEILLEELSLLERIQISRDEIV